MTSPEIYWHAFRGRESRQGLDLAGFHWDSGPEIGGNYWSDFKSTGNPGNVPRQIPGKGVDPILPESYRVELISDEDHSGLEAVQDGLRLTSELIRPWERCPKLR